MDLSQHKHHKASKLHRSTQNDDNQSQYNPSVQKVPEKRTIKKLKNNHHRNNNKFNSKTWTLHENLIYKQFLKNNFNLFNLERDQRRMIKINVLISRQVKSRTPDQCRSHHQKMLIYHGSVPSIVAYIQSLQMKQLQIKVPPSICDQSQNFDILNFEMKEINEAAKVDPPSLWDCMVSDLYIDI